MIKKAYGFTIVELLIVIVIIAILAAVTVVAYAGIQNRAIATNLQADLHNAATQLSLEKAKNGVYPATAVDIEKSGMTTLSYTREADGTYCLSAKSSRSTSLSFFITNGDTSPRAGYCPVKEGAFLQTISAGSCPTTRLRAVDARDNHTYWVQKLADGKCWMLTNLSYAGGGTNTYGDVKTLQNGTSDTVNSLTDPKYYIPSSGVNVTIEPTNPSTSTSGAGQYGYLYNYCAGLGGQATSACGSGFTPAQDVNVTICPAGWRLPTAGSGSDLEALLSVINEGNTSGSASGLRTNWLMMRAGYWLGGSFSSAGTVAMYMSTAQLNSDNTTWLYNSTNGGTSQTNAVKHRGVSVRCLAI